LFFVDGASMAACRKLWLWCGPQHDLGTINHTRTTGTVEFLDSLLMVHPWQHAEGLFGFGVYLNTIFERSTTCIHLFMVHPWQHAEGFGFSVWVWCVPQHHLGTINHIHTTGLVEFLDSLLMVHPWQHADGYGFGVNLNTILE
jgi:hypothetical protein